MGSKQMIAEGALEGVDAIFGQHVWGTLDMPYIDVTAGPRMAYSGRFTVEVHGESSHASAPHMGKDAITGAAPSSIICSSMFPARVIRWILWC